ncbi:hypothetical protein [Rathayibacter sp. SD072]|uniref:hypothetical protein n=1 Tax=Rathayibacter sp. SD072 TaxID=2781731 RepID=UPI001A975689|nr:hypothetical protein [Rathayibacter sp. SD072]MBO0982318.1 hypothetical protein [Rathayibacter sp. SD072]
MSTDPTPDPTGEAAQVEPQKPGRPRSNRRTLVISGSALLAIVLLVVGSIVVVNTIRAQEEAKAEAVASYTAVQVSHEGALSSLRNAINSAETLALTTGSDDVADAAVLADLTVEAESAKAQLEALETDEIEPDELSREDVITATDDLKGARGSVQDATSRLDEAREAVEESASIQSARVAEAAAAAAAEAARIAAEKRAAETAAAKAGAQAISFEDLSRAGNSIAGNYYRFEGEIIQDAGSGTYRVNMTKDPGYSTIFWEDTILVSIVGTPGTRLLEDDIISFVAASVGVQTYTTVFGASVTLPNVLAEAGDVAVTGRSD